jgi:hypothetical protein
MKKILRTNQLFVIVLFSLFSLASLPALAAQAPALPVEFTFIGNMKSQPVYQLTINGQPGNNEFSVIIRDEYGNILYWENTKSGTFAKKFLFNTDEIGSNTLQLEVYSRKTKESVLYKISNESRLNQELTVYKVAQ